MSASTPSRVWWVVALVLLWGAPRDALAWSCWDPSVEERVEAAPQVFRGQVVSQRTPWLLEPAATAALPERARLLLIEITDAHLLTEVRVLEVWRGAPTDAVLLKNPAVFPARPWALGEEVLVFTDQEGLLGPCTTLSAAETPEVLAALRALLGPGDTERRPALPWTARWGHLEWGALLVAAGLALRVALRRRRRGI